MLDAERTLKTQWLALTRKREAQARQADLATADGSGAQPTSKPRPPSCADSEAELESQRLAQFEATENLNQAQARFYLESGEVARVEQELRHLHATRERLANEIRLNQERQTQTDSRAAGGADAGRASVRLNWSAPRNRRKSSPNVPRRPAKPCPRSKTPDA
jgi:chromosome segregation protein